MSKKFDWSENSLREAVLNSDSIAKTLNTLGCPVSPGHYRQFHKFVKIYKIDTSHFLGKSWAQGKTRKFTKVSYEEILKKDSFYSIKSLKKRLFKDGILKNECGICLITEWNKKPITLQLDHINGDKFDNRIENLRILCPNCHSQTETFTAKNIKTIKGNKLCKCGSQIAYTSLHCRSCSAKSEGKLREKIKWPDVNDLLALVKINGYRKTALLLGVSGNAVKKRLTSFGLSKYD